MFRGDFQKFGICGFRRELKRRFCWDHVGILKWNLDGEGPSVDVTFRQPSSCSGIPGSYVEDTILRLTRHVCGGATTMQAQTISAETFASANSKT